MWPKYQIHHGPIPFFFFLLLWNVKNIAVSRRAYIQSKKKCLRKNYILIEPPNEGCRWKCLHILCKNIKYFIGRFWRPVCIVDSVPKKQLSWQCLHMKTCYYLLACQVVHKWKLQLLKWIRHRTLCKVSSGFKQKTLATTKLVYYLNSRA